MRLAQTLRQEGRQEGWQAGRQEGWQEGRQEEAARLLKRQLLRRFGPLPEGIAARIDAADLPTLEAWIDRVLDAESLAAVLQEG
jgi:predicted transposase YdaD